MNFYPHHIGDFNNATRHLTRVEQSVYRGAIELYYDTESVLTLDVTRLEKRLLCVTVEEKEALKTVLEEFFTLTNDGYEHERCSKEIAKYQANTGAKARAGIASAAKRKQNSTRVERPFNTCATNQEPITNNQEPITKRKGAKAPLSADELPTWMQSLVDLYHETLPELPAVRVMDVARRQALIDFRDWVMASKRPDGKPRATCADEFLIWTRDYMSRARNNDFIMGRGPKSQDHKNWRCSIEFLLSSKGVKKVVEETLETA
jgi:uncharacterized protein YdaU (DUF1376 family)